jgi:hypothetical protein
MALLIGISVNKLLKSDGNTYFTGISSLAVAPEMTLKRGYIM